jgi:hypothetical protein
LPTITEVGEAERIRNVGPGWSVGFEEDEPHGQLVRLAPDSRFVEESALEVELGEGYRRYDEVRGMESVEDDVVAGRRRLGEGETSRRNEALAALIASSASFQSEGRRCT